MAVSKQEMLDTIAGMTVMEIVDLISAMEEKFGVTAAAAVAAAVPPAAAAAGPRPHPLLPQPDGFGRHLAGAEEGLHGDGLHPGLRK